MSDDQIIQMTIFFSKPVKVNGNHWIRFQRLAAEIGGDEMYISEGGSEIKGMTADGEGFIFNNSKLYVKLSERELKGEGI